MQSSIISYKPYVPEFSEQVSSEIKINGPKKLSKINPSNDFIFKIEELQKTFSDIPAINQLNVEEQQNFLSKINNEQQNILENSTLHRTKIYFSKKDDQSKKGNHKAPWSFYLTVDPYCQSVTLELNEKRSKDSILGKGDNKTWKKAYEIKKTIEPNSNKIEGSKKAIARPHSLHKFEVEFAMPIKIHQEIYDEMIKLKLPGHVSKPPIIREHYKGDIKKSELVQDLFQSTVQMVLPKKTNKGIKYKLPINYERRLFLLECLFNTIDSFGILGVTHRDIKSSNLALKGKCKMLFPEVNDFDFVSKGALGLSDPSFFRWDRAGQLGLISNASDLIASMLIACEMLFLTPKGFDDRQHTLFKKGDLHAVSHLILPELNEQLIKFNLMPLNQPSIENIIDLCNQSISNFILKKDPEAIKYFIKLKYNIQILQIFCSYFEKENSWKDQLLGSCICHFMNMNSTEYKKFLTNHNRKWCFATFVNIWAKVQLTKIMDDEILSLLNFTEDEFSNEEDTASILRKLQILYDKGSLQIFMTPEKMFKYKSIEEQFDSLINISEMPKWPEEGDPELFSLLYSNNPEERKKGLEIGFANFGRGKDVSEEIKKISQDYLNELNEIQKEIQSSTL